MSSKDRTISVKLNPMERRRLGYVAWLKRRSVHRVMKEAILRMMEREEAKDMLKRWEQWMSDPHKELLRLSLIATAAGDAAGLPDHVVAQLAFGANRLRVIRGWRGMTLERLATALADIGADVHESTLDAIEDDRLRPEAGLTVALAKALDASVEVLLG